MFLKIYTNSKLHSNMERRTEENEQQKINRRKQAIKNLVRNKIGVVIG